MRQTPLSDRLRKNFSYGFYNAAPSVCRDTPHLDSEAADILKILTYLFFKFLICNPVKQCGLHRLVPVDDKAELVWEPCAVYEQIDSFPSLYLPAWVILKINVEPSAELTLAITA